MVTLPNYSQFDGLHWDTGPLRNALAYQGTVMPHTGQPISEALLFGISGGIVAGYFVFEYKGLDPWLHFLTRNTVDPGEAIVRRLELPIKVKQTDNPDKAVLNLTDALKDGKAPLVLADIGSFDYSLLPQGDGMWMVVPVVVYGYDEAANVVNLADRARVPLTTTPAQLAAARGRIKKENHRVKIVGALDMDRLPSAVESGIRACIAYMTEEPPLKPMAGKFGLDAYTKWADLLTNSKDKRGWAKMFPPGAKMYSGLTTGYRYMDLWFTGGSGARGIYADFLDEAAAILDKPALKDVAGQFRACADLWRQLTDALLPESIVPFKDARELMQRSYTLFLERGMDSIAERRDIHTRLDAIRTQMATEFPLSEAEAAAFREDLRARVLAVHEAEKSTFADLKAGL